MCPVEWRSKRYWNEQVCSFNFERFKKWFLWLSSHGCEFSHRSASPLEKKRNSTENSEEAVEEKNLLDTHLSSDIERDETE